MISVSFIPKVDLGFTYMDKLVHAAFYMIATFLLYLHFRNSENNRILYKIGAFCFVYGMVIEVLQYALPYRRAFEWADMLANATGIVLAIVLIKFALAPERR
nr:VanZ family protein [Robertkochia marina]